MNRWLHRYAVFTACATFCLIVAGALVTSNDAGLAVPDWPLSYGSLTPPWVGNIRYEHGHRAVAAFVGLLTVILSIWLWRREPRRWVRMLGFAALGAVIAQGLLGGITVLFFLPTAISVSHACLAQVFFCLTVVIAMVTGPSWDEIRPSGSLSVSPSRHLAVSASVYTWTAAAIFLQLTMGAALRHKGLGIIPHLIGAGVVTGMVMATLYRVMARHSNEPAVVRPAVTLGVLLSAQLILGAGSYWTRELTRDAAQPLPMVVWTTVAHVATGALMLASTVWLILAATQVPASLRSRAPVSARSAAIPT